ncbi:hypothetical protein GGS20DRAFT_426866 [Poronia punctata]|nr:hypothetical protein GGS20DRAFT_426866 [Poronia punctata]
MPSRYRDTEAYKWYLAGAQDGKRARNLPAFNTDGQGRVVLAVGEVFCRVSDDGGRTLCHDRHKHSSGGALKKHIRTGHELEVAPSVPGGLTMKDDQATMRYWDNIKRMADGEDLVLQTPRKAKAIALDSLLKNLPYKEDDEGNPIIDFSAMRNIAGLEDKVACTVCAS